MTTAVALAQPRVPPSPPFAFVALPSVETHQMLPPVPLSPGRSLGMFSVLVVWEIRSDGGP